MTLSNGLYVANFGTPLGGGAGVVTLSDGKLTGGDSMMSYVGTYTQDADQFSAQLVADKHTDVPGMESVFGSDHVNISITGHSGSDEAALTGASPQAPGITLQAHLRKIAS